MYMCKIICRTAQMESNACSHGMFRGQSLILCRFGRYCIVQIRFRPLFTKFLTPALTCELDNQLDEWLESTSHPADYLIRWLTLELKNLVTKAPNVLGASVSLGASGP